MSKQRLGRTRLNLQVPKDLLDAVKKGAKSRSTTVTHEVIAFFRRRVQQWRKEDLDGR